jgi:hypothetical protein
MQEGIYIPLPGRPTLYAWLTLEAILRPATLELNEFKYAESEQQ